MFNPGRQALFASPSTSAEDVAPRVHRVFSTAIEQNIATLPTHGAAAWLDALDDATLATLAQLYLNATEWVGRRSLAVDMLAAQLDPMRLARLARFFGFARVHHALLRSGAGAESAFMQAASPQFRGPELGDWTNRPHSFGGHWPDAGRAVEELFLSFRTAPLGLCSMRATVFQTFTVAAPVAQLAGADALRLDAWAVSKLQQHALPVRDALLGQLGLWLLAYRRAAPRRAEAWPDADDALGYLQADAFRLFDVEPALSDAFALEGGDFGSTTAWSNTVHCTPAPGATAAAEWMRSNPLRRLSAALARAQ